MTETTSETIEATETETPPAPVQARAATTAELLGEIKPAELPSDAAEFTGEKLPPPNTPESGDYLNSAKPPPAVPAAPPSKGCQCTKCKATGGNPDKRGRHHALCECPTCNERRGLPPSVPAAASDAPAAAVAGEAPPNPFDAVAAPAAAKNFEALAAMTFDVSTNTLAMVFGPEWHPQNVDEKNMVCGALANYYRSKDMSDLPPGIMLAIVVAAYSAARVSKPNTRSKLLLGWQWVKVKVGGLLKRKSHV